MRGTTNVGTLAECSHLPLLTSLANLHLHLHLIEESLELAPKTVSGNATTNGQREFQIVGAATAKLREPKHDRKPGLVSFALPSVHNPRILSRYILGKSLTK